VVDLRVDMHENAVADLRRIFETWKRCNAYYKERSRNPHTARPEEDAVAQLCA
jgi:uncharacterized Ntn-hydrolase superfamily protein